MKEIIEYLKERVTEMNKSSIPMDYAVVIDGAEAQKIIDFYERNKVESEPQNAPNITPEWDKIDEKYKWAAIDQGGDEFAFIRRPTKMQNMVNGLGGWTGRRAIFTGRYIDMSEIDWTKTLSKGPAKQ
jgi:hypothetical protein